MLFSTGAPLLPFSVSGGPCWPSRDAGLGNTEIYCRRCFRVVGQVGHFKFTYSTISTHNTALKCINTDNIGKVIFQHYANSSPSSKVHQKFSAILKLKILIVDIFCKLFITYLNINRNHSCWRQQRNAPSMDSHSTNNWEANAEFHSDFINISQRLNAVINSATP